MSLRHIRKWFSGVHIPVVKRPTLNLRLTWAVFDAMVKLIKMGIPEEI